MLSSNENSPSSYNWRRAVAVTTFEIEAKRKMSSDFRSVFCSIFDLPKYSQEIQPYEYGHPYTKKTRLWIKGLPNLKPTNMIDKSLVKTFIESGTSRYKNTDRNKNRYVARGSKDRSKFWVGIAQAMAQQWGSE